MQIFIYINSHQIKDFKIGLVFAPIQGVLWCAYNAYCMRTLYCVYDALGLHHGGGYVCALLLVLLIDQFD